MVHIAEHYIADLMACRREILEGQIMFEEGLERVRRAQGKMYLILAALQEEYPGIPWCDLEALIAPDYLIGGVG